jgi:serine-type D-Ala-D-Ala carboxypeptidase/endopeptidase (penicillin-binding protein 4)
MSFLRPFRPCFFLCLLLLGFSASAAEPQPAAATVTDLQQRLSDYISQPKYAAALWGLKVISLDSGKIIYEFNANKLFTPASNAKLYTVALALDRLGPDYRITTSFYAHRKPDESGTVSGNLIVFGRGDPSLNARTHNGNIDEALRAFVSRLSKAKVKRITGHLICDSSYFHGSPFGSGWLLNDLQHPYGAEISALSINDNILHVRIAPGEQVGTPCRATILPVSASQFMKVNNRSTTGQKGARNTFQLRRRVNENVLDVSGQIPFGEAARTQNVPVHNPPALFALLLSDALKRHGIELSGKAHPQDALDADPEPLVVEQLSELATVDSPPLRDLVREILKASQNLHAALVLAHIGEKFRSAETSVTATSEELGIRELGNFLAKIGIPKSEVLFEEGSGLSRNNLATPDATVTLLQFMARHASSNIFFESLPVAGVDGTLQQRLRSTAAQGKVRAKTGTLNRDSSLSGQVQTAAGEHLLFSIMLNRYNAPAGRAGAEVDSIALMLAEFTGRSP